MCVTTLGSNVFNVSTYNKFPMSEVSESINTVLKHLEVLGLTPNQSKVIVSMSKLGTADANTVVIESGVPRAKIYGIYLL